MAHPDLSMDPNTAGEGGSITLPFYLAVGLRYEPIPDRQTYRALLCFGPFSSYDEAKQYLKMIHELVDGRPKQTITIAKMATSASGAPKLQTVTYRDLSFVGGAGHEQRAIAQFTPAGLEQYLRCNGMSSAISPRRVATTGQQQQDQLEFIIQHIMQTIDRHRRSRRSV